MKRAKNVMLRLTADEHAALCAAAPSGEDLAVFARRSLLTAVAGTGDPAALARRAAAFVVAALSPEIGFDEALNLFDDHVPASPQEVADGRRDEK